MRVYRPTYVGCANNSAFAYSSATATITTIGHACRTTIRLFTGLYGRFDLSPLTSNIIVDRTRKRGENVTDGRNSPRRL